MTKFLGTKIVVILGTFLGVMAVWASLAWPSWTATQNNGAQTRQQRTRAC
jgi:hypothetical protein